MATDCPGCLSPPSQANVDTNPLTFTPVPRIDWPDLYQLHQTPKSYDAFCETIDQYDSHLHASIEIIRETVLHLRALRNSRSIVHRLPPELLIHIFSELVLASDPPSSTNLIAATHVCRRWRAIALDSPALWTNIVGTNTSRVETFIQRSQNVLLNIYLNLGTSIQETATRIPHFRILKLGIVHHRLRSLTVITGAVQLLDKIGERLARTPAPHLISLHLVRGTARSLNDLYYYQRTIPLRIYRPDMVDHLPTESPTPALRSLRLHPSFLSWSSGIFKNLSVLDIEAHQPEFGLPSEERMLDVLRDCPSLVELRLSLKGDFLDSGVSSTKGRTQDITLPLLSTLSLEDFSPACVANFLSHLTLPASTRYNLFLDQPDSDYSYPYFPKVFPEDLDRLPGISTIKTAELDIENDTTRLYLYPADVESNTPTVNFTLSMRMQLEDERLSVVAIPDDILGSTEKLVVIGSPDGNNFNEFSWYEMFRRAPHLRTLRLVRADAVELDEALCALAQGSGPTDEDLMCPQLEYVKVVGLMLFDPHVTDRTEELLEEFVRGRNYAGHRISLQRLLLEDVDVSDGCVSRLRGLRVDVVICSCEERSAGPDEDPPLSQ